MMKFTTSIHDQAYAIVSEYVKVHVTCTTLYVVRALTSLRRNRGYIMHVEASPNTAKPCFSLRHKSDGSPSVKTGAYYCFMLCVVMEQGLSMALC